jgi:spermidine/putrescine-binding protein
MRTRHEAFSDAAYKFLLFMIDAISAYIADHIHYSPSREKYAA